MAYKRKTGAANGHKKPKWRYAKFTVVGEAAFQKLTAHILRFLARRIFSL
jgi:hypothetical protein